MGQYASSRGHRAYCSTVAQNSPFSSLAVAVTIGSTHFANPGKDDQAELAWVAWLNTKMVYPQTVTHLSTNQAQRRETSLMGPMTLPLRQTAQGREIRNLLTVHQGCWGFILSVQQTQMQTTNSFINKTQKLNGVTYSCKDASSCENTRRWTLMYSASSLLLR